MEMWEKAFYKWQSFPKLEPSLKQTLKNMNEIEKKEAFYKNLSFGTGGMRGILGPGTDRMNIYTVRKAAKGLASYLRNTYGEERRLSVVIAYDSRHMSRQFAIECAKVFGVQQITTYIFPTLQPTPLLSFAVRYLKTEAGIMITASHNPPNYNGLKVYNEDGGQLPLKPSEAVIEKVNAISDELTIPTLTEEELINQGLLHWLDETVVNKYLQAIKQMSFLTNEEKMRSKDFPIVFTPLHGTATELVKKGLEQLNFTNVHFVKEQTTPDPDFSTVQSPNPEQKEAFLKAMALGKGKNAELLLATDPDADRLGVAVKSTTGEYELLTGNQIGSLLLDYILRHHSKSDLANGRLLKTIVTTELSREIAAAYDVKTVNTLTGFKFISEKIREYDATEEQFIFGFEESYGYLIDSFSRDKDGVQAAVMVAEMAYYWQQQGKTLLDALDDLYKQHGYYLEGIFELTLEGISGAQKIKQIMSHIRDNPPTTIHHYDVQVFEDYLLGLREYLHDDVTETIDLPQENVLKFILANDQWVCLRPSGTEPKIKCYYGVCSNNRHESNERLATISEAMKQLIKQIIT